MSALSLALALAAALPQDDPASWRLREPGPRSEA